MTSRDVLDRAQQELAAARYLAEGGFNRAAISRAYYAAFDAAEAALLSLGQTRSKHSAVVAAFNQLVVKEGGADPAAARMLSSLFTKRAAADYSSASVSDSAATAAIADADTVVTIVESWLANGG